MKLNIPEAYNQIQIKEGDKQKIIFCTYYRYFKYLIISFKLTNALVTFQAFINNILKKYLDIFIIIYFDDILLYSRTKEEYKQYIN